MQNITSIVEGLGPKVEKLLHLHEQLKSDNNQLAQANADLQRQLEQRESELQQLEEKFNTLKMARAIQGDPGGNNLDLKLKINELVREIDKCIAQLNR